MKKTKGRNMEEATKETQMALSEVYDILKHTDRNLINKISRKFIQYIFDNRDINYIPNIDYSRDIYSQNLKYETVVILSIIYRDYLCSPEEKNAIVQKDKVEIEKIKQEETKKYNIDVFEKVQQQNNNNIESIDISKQENASLVVYKESLIKRIFNKIKSWFKKK